jgi:hypothetical protein
VRDGGRRKPRQTQIPALLAAIGATNAASRKALMLFGTRMWFAYSAANFNGGKQWLPSCFKWLP